MGSSTLLWNTIALVVCLLCSAFFSSSETALLSLPKARIFKMAKDNKTGQMIRKAINSPDRLLGAILLGNNLFNVAGSVVGTAIFLELVGGGSLWLATICLTILFLVMAEVTPKTLAAFNPERVSMIVIRPLNAFAFLMQPFVRALTWLSRRLLRLAGQDVDQDEMVTRDDLVTLVLSGRKEGYLDRAEQQMLRGVLDLSRISVGEVMVPLSRAKTLDGDQTAGQAMDQASDLAYSRYPVWGDDPEHIIGYIHLRDLLVADRQAMVRDLAHQCYFVPESRTVQGQLMAFRREKVTLALVVDEFGQIIGLVTVEDLLEEIVGEIVDEFDTAEVGIVPHPSGGHLIDGRLAVREINRLVGLGLPEGPYHTLSGLVHAVAQRIPETGQSYTWQNLDLTVTAMDGKAVGRVWIRKAD